MEQIIHYAYKVMKPISTVANYIGMVALAVMMFLTAVDVTLRKVANMPIMGSSEMIQFTMVMCGGLGLAYCAVEKGHVVVDLVTSRLSRRVQGIMGSITSLIALAVCIVLTWQTVNYVNLLMKSKQMTAVLIVPIYPFVAIFAFSLALYCIVLIIHFLEFIREGTGK